MKSKKFKSHKALCFKEMQLNVNDQDITNFIKSNSQEKVLVANKKTLTKQNGVIQ